LFSFTIELNLHDFRYEGGAPINSGSQITLVNEKRNMAQANKLGPADSIGTGGPITTEPRVISGFPLSLGNIVLESAMPRREINGGPGRTRTFDLPIMRPG